MATKSFPSAPIVTSTNKLYEKAFKTFTFQFKTSFVEGESPETPFSTTIADLVSKTRVLMMWQS